VNKEKPPHHHFLLKIIQSTEQFSENNNISIKSTSTTHTLSNKLNTMAGVRLADNIPKEQWAQVVEQTGKREFALQKKQINWPNSSLS
jgi:hypothetical protein